MMNWGNKQVFLVLNSMNSLFNATQRRTLVKVQLKWAQNKTLDNVVDKHTDLKAAYLLKDAINRSSVGYITSKSISDSHKLLGLTIPTLRFIRRYPTLFHEFPHPKYPSLSCFRLTDIAKNLHDQEVKILEAHEPELLERLCKVLMMTKHKMVPFQSLYPLKWDLGLPDDFDRNFIQKYPDYFGVVKDANGVSCLKLLKWNDEFAVSVLQKNVKFISDCREFQKFRKGRSSMSFSQRFPKGYGGQKNVKAWMEEFQKLPYISPYEDSNGIDMLSDIMEKRIVGVLHEFLSLTVHKMTKRDYLGSLRDELNLLQKFTRIYTRYPGIFYLTKKCKLLSVALKEGYCRGKLAEPSPLAELRGKFYYAMRTGLLYSNKGVRMLSQPDALSISDDNAEEESEDECEEEDKYEKGIKCNGTESSEAEFHVGIYELYGKATSDKTRRT